MRRIFKTLTAAAVCCGIASAGAAQSAFGCDDLDGFHALPSVEGTDGVFYRVLPELQNFHAFSDETVEDMARLSQTLAQAGTMLIYLPIPPKSLVLTEHLPRRAYDYGFDPNLAATVYDDMIRRLRDAGVVVADARKALVAGSRGGELPYFRADYRLSPAGARLAAQSVAQAMMPAMQVGNVGSAGMGTGFVAQPAAFVPGAPGATPTGEMQEVDSYMRRVLQRHCLMELPRVEVPATAPQDTTTAQSAPMFNGGGFGRSVALVGTEYSATPGVDFAGALSRAMGQPVTQVSLDGGGAFEAFVAYVTSDAFQQARPSVLVWENPVYNNLAQFGDQPMRELTAAVGNNCRVQLPVMAALDANTATANLSGVDPNTNVTLFLDTDGTAAGEASFTFRSPSGLERTKTVVRRHPDARTGRFFVPMSGLWPEGAMSVDIALDMPLGSTPRLTACFN